MSDSVQTAVLTSIARLDSAESDLKTIFQEDTLVIFKDAILAAESLQQPEGGAPASNHVHPDRFRCGE